MSESKLLHEFHATLPSVNYVFKNGKPAIFILGVYRTDVQWEIDELNTEISLGHPHIYVDPKQVTIESKYLDPMVALRERIIAEHQAEEARKNNPNNDMGESKQGKLNVQNSQDIAPAAIGGSGTGLATRLANLQSLKPAEPVTDATLIAGVDAKKDI